VQDIEGDPDVRRGSPSRDGDHTVPSDSMSQYHLLLVGVARTLATRSSQKLEQNCTALASARAVDDFSLA